MLVTTKYHWNISFQKKKMSSKYVVKNASSVTHFVWQTFFHWISRVCQIKNIKYIHQNLRYYETILLYLSGSHLPLLMFYKKINGHIEKLNTEIYWYEKNQYIEKKVSCWNKCSVFRTDIETVMYVSWNTFSLPHEHVCTVLTFT